MTAAQELFEALKNAKPGPNYQPKPAPAPNLGISHSDIRASRLFERMPAWPFASLRELGGSASVVTTLGFATEYCATCAKPMEQRRVHVPASKTLPAGSVIEVQPCGVCK